VEELPKTISAVLFVNRNIETNIWLFVRLDRGICQNENPTETSIVNPTAPPLVRASFSAPRKSIRKARKLTFATVA
jgi:hypothetical protein